MAQASRAPSPQGTVDGQWIRLVPLAAYPDAAIEELRFRLGMRPEMVMPGVAGRPAGSRFGEASIIADAATGELLGILSNVELAEYPGVAGLVIYVDQTTRAGYAMEAWWRYVARMFELGVTKMQMEVMSFNTPVHRIMRRIGARPEVVLREHFYIAGRRWDGTLYGFDRTAWQAADKRYRSVVARPVALASSKQERELARPKMKEKTMKVDYLILADAAIAAEGKHFLHGAGWDTIVARGFPVFHPHMSAALRLRVASGDPTHRLGVDLLDPDGGSLLSAPIYSDVNAGTAAAPVAGDQVLCLVFNFGGLHFATAGTYAVAISIDGAEAQRTEFFVRAHPDG